MLCVDNLSWTPPKSEIPLIDRLSLRLPAGHLVAVIGPSGSGKSTFLRLLAGIYPADQGEVTWKGRARNPCGFEPGELALVPQFSNVHESLSVMENIADSLSLRQRLRWVERMSHTHRILDAVGLAEISQRRARVLSGGQRRRLALGIELASDPDILLCDEVTSGLDPQAETDVTELLYSLAHNQGRLVISVIHSLSHLHRYDSILVLHGGHVTFHAQPEYLLHYFHVDHAEEIYPRLTQRTPSQWHASWVKHRPDYYETHRFSAGDDQLLLGPLTSDADLCEEAPGEKRQQGEDEKPKATPLSQTPLIEQTAPIHSQPDKRSKRKLPGLLWQAWVVLRRRFLLMVREPGGLMLQLALLIGFPLVVALFALNGLPQIQKLNMGLDIGLLQQLRESYDYVVESTRAGGLVSGLVMLQVILLGLIASNNAAREIASSRLLIEKEKLAGLRPSALVTATLLYLALLVTLQSLWMAWFVDSVCRFPGSAALQALALLFLNGALTLTCLAISSWSHSSEKASLLSLYVVGFQLPLSGAVLALPEFIGAITRPFIAAYWAWSGFIQTMRQTDHYDVVLRVSETPFSPLVLCFWVLGAHMVLALFVVWQGVRRPAWDAH